MRVTFQKRPPGCILSRSTLSPLSSPRSPSLSWSRDSQRGPCRAFAMRSLLWLSSTCSSLCYGHLADVALSGCLDGHTSSSSSGQYNASGESGSSMTSRSSRCGQTSMSSWREARMTIYLATLALGTIMLTADPFTYLCNQPGHHCIGCGVKTGIFLLLHGNIQAAIRSNPLVLILAICTIAAAIDTAHIIARNVKRSVK